MAIRGAELHHAAVRMRPDQVEQTRAFYGDVLGLSVDPGTRAIPDIDGFWFDLDNDAQLHVFGVEGTSQYARQPDQDPFTQHVALGVPDISAAIDELDRQGVEYWRVGRDEQRQVFLHDPRGNMIELHQTGTCRCKRSDRAQP